MIIRYSGKSLNQAMYIRERIKGSVARQAMYSLDGIEAGDDVIMPGLESL